MTNNNNIDDLLVKVILGEATTDELQQAQEWIAHSSANETYFNDFQLIWAESRRLAIHSTINEEEAWSNFQQRIASPATAGNSISLLPVGNNGTPAPGSAIPSLPGSGPSRVIPIKWISAAAILILLAVGGWFFYKATLPSTSLLAIQSGIQVLSDTLPEGSIITLNKQSSIRYDRHFNNGIRQVDMEGEAFFTVAPDKNKPFIVHTGDISITVLGTSFNVNTTHNTTEIIVETGQIEIAKKGYTLRLKAGEKALLHPDDIGATKETNADQLYKYYRTNTFECNGTPLWRLVEKLNQVYPTSITIADNEIRNLSLSVTFMDESLDGILDVVAKTLSIKVIHKDQQVILKKR